MFKLSNSSKIYQSLFYTTCFITLSALLPTPTAAISFMGVNYSKNIDQPILGDRLEITARVVEGSEPFTEDLTVKVSIRNQKPGQSCEVTDNNTKGDGIITFYCESKEEAGGIEVELQTQNSDRFIGETFRTDFYDPNKYCSPFPQAPVLTNIVKQNDVAADVAWTQAEPFAGSFTISYGTAPTNLSNRKTHTNLSNTKTVISGLDSSATYYIQVESNTCGTQIKSQLFSYTPATGGFAPYTGSTKPKPSPTATSEVKPTSTASLPSPSPTAIATETSATPSASPSESPKSEPLAEATTTDSNKQQKPTYIFVLLGLGTLSLLTGAGAWWYFVKKNKNTSSEELKENEASGLVDESDSPAVVSEKVSNQEKFDDEK